MGNAKQIAVALIGTTVDGFLVQSPSTQRVIRNRLLGEIVQLTGVRHAVTKFVDRQGALRDREFGFRHGVGFGQYTALRGNVRKDVPMEGVALVQALLTGVLDVSKLAELRQRLDRHAKFIGQVQTVHEPAEGVGTPELRHSDYHTGITARAPLSFVEWYPGASEVEERPCRSQPVLPEQQGEWRLGRASSLRCVRIYPDLYQPLSL